MKKGKSQAQRMKERAKSAEHEIAAKNQEIAKLREQLAARNPGPSSTTTPPGRGTPSQRNPASRPQREDRSSQASIPEEAKGEEPDGDESDGDSVDQSYGLLEREWVVETQLCKLRDT